MAEVISFEKELNNLREAGFTEEQVNAIWKLTFRLSVELISRSHIYGNILSDAENVFRGRCCK
jgi:hypothetical protein